MNTLLAKALRTGFVLAAVSPLGHPSNLAIGEEPAAHTDASAAVEAVPPGEADRIKHIIKLTLQQLRNRYAGQEQIRRGVHAKDHGCVTAVFEVVTDLDPAYRVGVFAEPGKRFDAWVRFSNAATLVLPDNPIGQSGKPTAGSRGMAVKLIGAKGTPLLPPHGALTQDFLMVNHPVFAFANVEDYEVLSEVLADPANMENPGKFFVIQSTKDPETQLRARRTLEIAGRIQAPTESGQGFQPQPACPVDCRYFSAAPFRFGDGSVMKYSVVPVDPPTGTTPNVADPNYLRTALIERLKISDGAKPVVFEFKVQRRENSTLDLAKDIENVCNNWPEDKYPFVKVATLTIPPQRFNSPESQAACENLTFSPWHGLIEHRPLGGINRMRKAVYEASTQIRHLPKEPAAASSQSN
ncbi:catalase family protein [Singulisphaera rosea]